MVFEITKKERVPSIIISVLFDASGTLSSKKIFFPFPPSGFISGDHDLSLVVKPAS